MDIGKKLRLLRQQRNLTQEELADRCELSKGFISQVERNLASPSIATLTDLLECLGTDLKEFFSDSEDDRVVFSRDDMSIKQDEETLRGSITWLVPSARKNRMEPILVELGVGGSTYELGPNDGEEFGYVLQGAVDLLLGKRKYTVRAGESFCIHPGDGHTLTCHGSRSARFIWVSDPPVF